MADNIKDLNPKYITSQRKELWPRDIFDVTLYYTSPNIKPVKKGKIVRNTDGTKTYYPLSIMETGHNYVSGGPMIACFYKEKDAKEYCDFKNKQLITDKK